MYRLCYMSNKWIGTKIPDHFTNDDEELENIQTFADEDYVVLICQDLEEAAEALNVEKSDIEIVN